MPKLRGTAARTARDGFAETLAYTEFPPEHWLRIGTNNGIVRINREIGRRTRVVGTLPDGNSALMLVTARLKYIVEHERGKRRNLDMSKLEEMDELKGKAKGQKRTGPRTAKSICERILTVLPPPQHSPDSSLMLTGIPVKYTATLICTECWPGAAFEPSRPPYREAPL